MLPRNLEQLHGLTLAGLVRVSTDQQHLSPATQRRTIERFAQTHGIVLARTVEITGSGRTVWRHPDIGGLLRAAESHEIRGVVVAFIDRSGRNAARTMDFVDDLHESNAVLVNVEGEQLSGNPAHHRAMRSDMVVAHNASELIGEKVAAGIDDRNTTHSDQWGRPPLGFTRSGGEPSILQIDRSGDAPTPIDHAIALFERYSAGNISINQLAQETGRNPNTLKDILANRVYAGWVQNRGEWLPAPWRANPPVSDDLFDRVQAVRARRGRGGGPHDPERPNPWRGLFRCSSCDTRLTLDGYGGHGTSRYQRLRHINPCGAWGKQERHPITWWTDPLIAQITEMDTSEDTLTEIISYLNAGQTPNIVDSRFQRARNAVYDDHKTRKITGPEADARIARIDAEETSYRPEPAAQVDPVMVREAWEDLQTTWKLADEQSRAAVIRAVYARIDATREGFEGVTLTPEAERIGLTLALPERVTINGEACPRGLEPPTFRSAT